MEEKKRYGTLKILVTLYQVLSWIVVPTASIVLASLVNGSNIGPRYHIDPLLLYIPIAIVAITAIIYLTSQAELLELQINQAEDIRCIREIAQDWQAKHERHPQP